MTPKFLPRRQLLKLWSVRIQGLWAAACGAYVALPAEQQAALAALVGLGGDGGVAALSLFAQASIAISAATIAARATRQPGLDA